MVNIKPKKNVEFTKDIFSTHIKICRFEIKDGVKYVYCIKHAYKFLLREQLGFAAVLWRLRQCVSCIDIVLYVVLFVQKPVFCRNVIVV